MKSAGQPPPSKQPEPDAAVRVRIAAGEHAWFNQQMAGHHYLGAGCPVGTSTGYSRHRADFYAPNDRSKKLWLYELNAQARRQLQAVPPPAICLHVIR